MSQRKKPLHLFDTPETRLDWPRIPSVEIEDLLVDVLISITRSIGSCRGSKTPAEVAKYVDCGSNVVTRNLSALASHRAPRQAISSIPTTTTTSHSSEPTPHAYSVVVCLRHGATPGFTSHIPALVAAASQNTVCQPQPIRLVGLTKPCAPAFESAFGIPVTMFALHQDAPQNLVKAALRVVDEHVPPLDVPKFFDAHYIQTTIQSIDVAIGQKKKLPLPNGQHAPQLKLTDAQKRSRRNKAQRKQMIQSAKQEARKSIQTVPKTKNSNQNKLMLKQKAMDDKLRQWVHLKSI